MQIKSLIALICLFGFSVSVSFAQQDVRVVTSDVNEKVKVVDKKFLIVGTALVFSSIYDVETTSPCVKSGYCSERNLIAAPFVKSGRPAMYGLVMGSNTGLMYLGYRLKKHSDPGVRRVWWIAPVIGIAVHTLAGSLNLRFTF